MSPEFRKSKRRYVHHGARLIYTDGSVLGPASWLTYPPPARVFK